MTKLQLVEEFRKLPAGDKASLIDSLWAELAVDLERSSLTNAEREALDQRLLAIAQDKRPARPWSELRAEFLTKP